MPTGSWHEWRQGHPRGLAFLRQGFTLVERLHQRMEHSLVQAHLVEEGWCQHAFGRTAADPAIGIRRHPHTQAPELVEQGERRNRRLFLWLVGRSVTADRLRDATEPANALKSILCHSRHALCARVVHGLCMDYVVFCRV